MRVLFVLSISISFFVAVFLCVGHITGQLSSITDFPPSGFPVPFIQSVNKVELINLESDLIT